MEGMTSICEHKDDVIIKRYFTDQGIRHERGLQHHWERECRALDMLKGKKHTPEIISAENNEIVMSYCGEQITQYNCPDDWEKQCHQIDRIQHRIKLYHYDIKLENICVKDEIIYLIDWGMISDKFTDFRPIINTIRKLWD
jgi:tRNA A-37 threonylcarbamoyl transferase component Bud32